MKLVLFADIHLTRRRTFSGRDPLEQLRRALRDVLARHGDAAALVILGDLTDNGLVEEYQLLARALAGFPLPVHLLLGNHDDRDNFHAVFGGRGYVQDSAVIDGLPCHMLDTLWPGETGGSLADGRLRFLEDALIGAGPAGIVFLHHPPIVTGAPAFDAAGLADRADFARCIERHPGKVRAIFFGHCQMPVTGTVDGVPALCVPSLVEQSHPVFDRLAYSSNPGAQPAYGVLLLGVAGFTFHSVPFGLREHEEKKEEELHGLC